MDQQGIVQPLINKPFFNPTYLNIEYIFHKILDFIGPIISFFTNSQMWLTLGIISILCIAIIIFSLVRMREIQVYEKRELDHEIHEALARDEEAKRTENPRWHYILTLIESSNESDWRVAIIEADTMLEEVLKNKGFTGETTSDLLEAAKLGGYPNIQGAWDAHLVRNQIAHSGSEFSLTQVEGRRVIRMYQSFFEDLKAI
jgi:hypothetical protein